MTRRVLILFCILILSLVSQAIAGGPRLTLLFCANNEAEVRPCPT